MTIPFICLVIGAFLPYLWAFTGSYLRARQLGGLDNNNPRQQVAQAKGAAARAYAAQQNAWEALPVFAIAVFMANVADPESVTGNYAAMVWVLARLSHGLLYISDLAAMRSLSFLVGIACVITLITVAAG